MPLQSFKSTREIAAAIDCARRMGFLTGSRAFGVNDPYADFDYVVEASDFRAHMALSTREMQDNYGRSSLGIMVRVHESDPWTNIIIASDRIVFDAWLQATSKVRSRLSDPEYKEWVRNRTNRINEFHDTFRDVFRAAGSKYERFVSDYPVIRDKDNEGSRYDKSTIHSR